MVITDSMADATVIVAERMKKVIDARQEDDIILCVVCLAGLLWCAMSVLSSTEAEIGNIMRLLAVTWRRGRHVRTDNKSKIWSKKSFKTIDTVLSHTLRRNSYN